MAEQKTAQSYNVAFGLPDGSVNVTNVSATSMSWSDNGYVTFSKGNSTVAIFTSVLYAIKQ